MKSKSINGASNCIDNPTEADIIIFLESHCGNDPYFTKVLSSKIYKKYSNKCILYHDADLSITPLRTISPSIESWQYNPKRKRAAHYIARACENTTIDNAEIVYDNERAFLYSFIGSRTQRVRKDLFDMKHGKDVFIKDTTGLAAWEMNSDDKNLYERQYYEVIRDSFFSLVPRGIGPCSYRLFETMQLGRVPIIISDAWVRIPNVEWDAFSITVPEKNIFQIPEILRERRNEAIAMGAVARRYWENFFSPQVSFDQIASAAADLLKNKYTFFDKLKDYSQFFMKISHFENYLRYKKNQIKPRLLKK